MWTAIQTTLSDVRLRPGTLHQRERRTWTWSNTHLLDSVPSTLSHCIPTHSSLSCSCFYFFSHPQYLCFIDHYHRWGPHRVKMFAYYQIVWYKDFRHLFMHVHIMESDELQLPSLVGFLQVIYNCTLIDEQGFLTCIYAWGVLYICNMHIYNWTMCIIVHMQPSMCC